MADHEQTEAPGHFDGDGCTFPTAGHFLSPRLTAQQAADRAHVSRSGLRTLAARALLVGVDLRAPRAEWPDARTPLYDGQVLDEYLAARPGRGRRVGS